MSLQRGFRSIKWMKKWSRWPKTVQKCNHLFYPGWIILPICHSGEFPHLATRVNALFLRPILSITPLTTVASQKPQKVAWLISRRKVVNIVSFRYIYICISKLFNFGKFTNLPTRANARVSWPILSPTPCTSQPAKSENHRRFKIFSYGSDWWYIYICIYKYIYIYITRVESMLIWKILAMIQDVPGILTLQDDARRIAILWWPNGETRERDINTIYITPDTNSNCICISLRVSWIFF